jgi:putative ABC transport system permease protein
VTGQQLLSGARGTEAAPARGSVRTILVFAEITLATLLVISASLLIRSFVALSNVTLGFDPAPVLALRTSAPSARYKEPDQIRQLYSEVLGRIAATPGVTAVGGIHLLPLTPDNWNPGVAVQGQPPSEQYPADVNWRVVTPHYFTAMSVPLLGGRQLGENDNDASAPVALVNEAFVQTVLRGAPAIGRRIRTTFENGQWAEIVGVVGNVRQHTLEQPSAPEIYRPFAQHPMTSMRLMARTSGDPSALAPSIRAAIGDIDRDIALADVGPFADVVARTLGEKRFPMLLASLFAVAALSLGIVGIVGVLSFDLAERKQEIGIRLALGAAPGQITSRFLRRAAALAISGVLAGACAAVLTGRLLRAMLFGISPTDPLTIAVAGIVFVGLMLAAAYGPARRASLTDPLRSLRPD